MNALLQAPLPGIAADAALKGFLVLLAALVATRLMRRASAASRHMVWLARQVARFGSALSWKQVALFVWMAGAAVLLIRLFAGLVAVWPMERRAKELDDERWTALTDRLSRRMRLGRIVRLLRGPTSAVPMTWGAFRPVILLPGRIDQHLYEHLK